MLAVYFVFVLCYSVFGLGVPSGYTTFFKGDTCPDGWEETPLVNGRLIVSTSGPSNVLKTVQKPLNDMENRVHNHTFESTFKPNYVTFTYDGVTFSVFAAHYDNYVWNQSTENSVSELPFVQLLMCTILDSVRLGVGVPYGSIAYFPETTVSCYDLGSWVELQSSEGRTIISGGGNEYYVSNDDKLQNEEDRKHTHPFEFYFVQSYLIRADKSGGLCKLASTNIMTGNTSSESLGIPYIQMQTCITTDTDVDVVGLPNSTLFFSTLHCPKGYQDSKSYQGRYIVALPENGTAGATFGGNPVPTNYTKWPTHNHYFTYNITLPCNWCTYGSDESLILYCNTISGTYVTNYSNGTFPYVATHMCELIQ